MKQCATIKENAFSDTRLSIINRKLSDVAMHTLGKLYILIFIVLSQPDTLRIHIRLPAICWSLVSLNFTWGHAGARCC